MTQGLIRQAGARVQTPGEAMCWRGWRAGCFCSAIVERVCVQSPRRSFPLARHSIYLFIPEKE